MRDALNRLFRFRIPLNTVDTLLVRAKKRGLVSQEHGVYRINRDAVVDLRFATERDRVVRMYDHFLGDLVGYAAKHFGLSWTVEDVERALHGYLTENALALFRSTATGTLLQLPRRPSKSDRYVFGSYVNHLVQTNAPEFESLRVVVEGTILATGIFLPSQGAMSAKFIDTAVYFDTKFLINALGHTIESLGAPCRELLEILYEKGARLCCFSHTLDEVRSVLYGCAHRISGRGRSPWGSGYGPTFDYFLTKGFNESDVYLLIQTLERDLEALRIRTLPKPPYHLPHAIDEASLEATIRQHVKYANEYALFRDIDSISGVIRLRAGRVVPTIEKSRAVFVTSNTALARAANEFWIVSDHEGGVPVAISDWDLTNLLWLKEPQAAPDLPRKQMIADLYAAIQPDDQFRRRYLDEIERLEKKGAYTEEDVYVLRHSLEARAVAMDLTVGDNDAFTQGTIAEVLEIVQQRMEGEVRSKYEEAQAASSTLQQQLHAEEIRRRSQLSTIRARATTSARYVARTAVVLVAVVLTAALYLTLPLVPGSLGTSNVFRVLAAALVLGVSIANWVWGTTVTSVCRRIELTLDAPIRKLFCWVGGIDAAELAVPAA